MTLRRDKEMLNITMAEIIITDHNLQLVGDEVEERFENEEEEHRPGKADEVEGKRRSRHSSVREEQKTIHQMCRDGDMAALEDMSDLQNRKDDLDSRKLTPLHYAARYSRKKVLKLLLEKKADVNKRGEDDMTPLHYAARYSKKASTHALKLLRDHREKQQQQQQQQQPEEDSSNSKSTPPDTRSASSSPVRSESPSMEALTKDIIQLLLKYKAEVNARDKYGLTALHHAAMRGNVGAMGALLKSHGVEKEPRDVQLSTPLHLAATYNHARAVSELLEEGNANPACMDSAGRTPLHLACMEGHLELAQLLLLQKMSLDMLTHKDEEGCTPLLLAVGSGNSTLVAELVTRGADVNAGNTTKVHPAHSAARMGDLATLRVLATRGARLDAQNALGQTPMFLAAQHDHPEVIRFLHESGANLNLGDKDGMSPLLVAAKEGHEECTKVLVELKANMQVVDKNERSALYHAAERNNPGVLKVLLSRSETAAELLVVNDQHDNLPIHASCVRGNVECARLLLEAAGAFGGGDGSGAGVNNKNEDEQTPLHLSAVHGRVRVAELLLSADPNAVMNADEDGNTALHLACMNRRSKVAEVLLAKGADVQSRNAKKWTPLDCAAAAGANSCAKLLLQNDAPIDPVDRTGTTPLHLAAENGHEKIILLLLNHGANITSEDAYGRNLLELAILSRKRQVVKTVLQHKDWRKAMRTTMPMSDSHGDMVPNTPMRLLIRIYPDLAQMVFDQCVTVEKTKADEILPTSTLVWQTGAKIKLDYEFIDDAFCMRKKSKKEMGSSDQNKDRFEYCRIDPQDTPESFMEPYDSNGKVVMDNHPLMIMARQKQKNLLRHPLCLALVRHKWKSFGRYVYYGTLFLYCLFLAALTSYILVAPNPASFPEYQQCSNSSDNSTVTYWSIQLERIAGGLRKEQLMPVKSTFETFCQITVMVLIVPNIIMEFVQLYRARQRYFSLSNLFDWVVYSLSFSLVYDTTTDSHSTGMRTCWQWEMGAIVIVMAWLNLLGDIRQLPYLGIYVIMFFDILKTFLRFVTVFSVFLVAFALGFHTLLITDDKGSFGTFGYSLLKTTVMMLGEFEFEAMFFSGSPLPFESSTVILFVIFLVVMAIIIMNLLVGLAVDDIKAVQEQAVLKRLAMQVELVLDVERILPSLVLRKANRLHEVMEMKERKWWNFFTDVVSRRSIVREVTSLRTEVGLEDLADRQDLLEDSMRQLKSDVKSIVTETEKIMEMLVALVEHNNIQISSNTEEL